MIKTVKKEKFMKSWVWIVWVCSLILIVSAITVEARHVTIAKSLAQAEATTAAEPTALTCPKCQSEMEQGFLLDIQGPAVNDKRPSDWVKGPAERNFWQGVKVKNRRQVVAYRCTHCGYLELYAR